MFVSLVAVLFAVTVPVLGARAANAQATYGTSSYGTEAYSAEDENSQILPPNTGFQVVQLAATEQPLLFWGSAGAILAAVAGVFWIVMKPKQEN